MNGTAGEMIEQFQQGVLDWYQQTGRDLPWRKTADPYHILVSEFMLQQTQVDRVIPKYRAFLERFPSVKTLASAEQAEVLKYWSGLGYNRRALFLHQAAKQIVDDFPDTPEALKKLNGVGDYAAHAISAFAFNQDVVVVDTNIRRILFRVFIARQVPSDKLLRELAQKVLPQGKSRDWYNALMDLGATICTAKSPTCIRCPISKFCKAKSWMDEEKTTQPLLDLAIPKQSKFQGSNRMYRGKILKALQTKAMTLADLCKLLNKDSVFIQTILDRMIKEGFLKQKKETFCL